MSAKDAVLLQLQLTGCLALSSPRVHLEVPDSREEVPTTTTPDDGARSSSASGSVAVILQTYLCATNVTKCELIPGYAIAAAFAMKTFAWCIVSVYLRPRHEQQLLFLLIAELKKLAWSHNYDSFLFMGDFNQARKLSEWELMLTLSPFRPTCPMGQVGRAPWTLAFSLPFLSIIHSGLPSLGF